ncbi:cytochrome B [Hufsiella ginkgonis]|uniref:Cytochrome B n=1 Tax=Hufsiella ginkgonis TaxID=2695274 RepID=A0A7K1XUF9_9SPHI|nr:cytochrome B [Hufsiella ginkgonis]MXV14126.1 cytochrome B [Hufsiella ginkgonis]
MYKILLESHSGLRYVVLVLVIVAIIFSFDGWLGKKAYGEGVRKLNLFAMIAVHMQFLVGLILYFYSPLVQTGSMGTAMKDPTLRYWTVEHATMMIIAVALFTIGHSRSKKEPVAALKHRTIAIFYTLAFLVVIGAIVHSGRGLFAMTHL